MKNYIQFKDGVAFAFVATDSPIPGAVELDQETHPESVLGKKRDGNRWVEPEQIRYVQSISPDGVLTGIGTTVYASEATGEIISEDVQIGYRKVDGEWTDVERLKDSTRPVGFWSWTWDYQTLSWIPPTPKPQEGPWEWDEETLSWIPAE